MTRRAPYRCGRCGKRSLLKPRDNTVAAILTLGTVVIFVVTLPHVGFAGAIVIVLALYVVVIGGIMWWFMRLGPTQDNE